MNDTKREELEKACKKEKDQKVRTRMVAVRMVRVLDMSVDEAADILVHCPTWVRDWLSRYDEGGLEGLRDLPRCGRPRRILLTTKYGLTSSSSMTCTPLPSLRLQQATKMSRALPGGVFLIMRQIFSLLASGRNRSPFGIFVPMRTGVRENTILVLRLCPDQNLLIRRKYSKNSGNE